MKVVSPNQMSGLESQAYKEGASESDFMEEAGSGVALVVQDYIERYNLDHIAVLLCGKGNNAADAYVAGIQLLHLDFEVFAIQPTPIGECSPLCKQSYERFMHEGGRLLENRMEHPLNGIIIDGIFGTGFHGKVSEPYSSLIQWANNTKLPIISIDIPSGLNGETGLIEGEAIIASETVFLGLPKQGFFLNNGWNCVGKLRYVDFGLPKHFIEAFNTNMVMLEENLTSSLLPSIKRNRHKYETGYIVGLAGSQGMPGAAILSASSALRGGAGIVRLYYPEGMRHELVGSPLELICTSYQSNNYNEMTAQMNRASAVFIGPGLGQTEEIKALLRAILPLIKKPCVLDADALSIIAAEAIALPKDTILTPHHGEMMRLLNLSTHPKLTLDFLNQCLDFATKKQITLVLKGAPTFIFQANHPIKVNPTGDPGMATAGSGDVLTGLIAALLGQGLSSMDASTLGVYLHGLAGEYAAEDMTSYGMCASDIIYRYPEAFKFLIHLTQND